MDARAGLYACFAYNRPRHSGFSADLKITFRQMKRPASVIKLTQWEHWPTLVYYIPLLPFFVLRSLKAGHPLHFTTANPAILFSGIGTESKFKTLSLLPEQFRPKSLQVFQDHSFEDIKGRLQESDIRFPIIAKPDIGFRGYLVKKIDSENELKNYLLNVKQPVILQEFVRYEKELGIFYNRIPGQEKGSITSITIKKFIRIKGDGRSSVSELILADERAFLYFDLFKIIHREKLEQVLDKDEELVLSVIGNHSKGTQFLNGNHLIDEDLNNFADEICKQIPGWYYGRLDIKYLNLESLLANRDFKVLEVNGIISEPTHIYDASHKNASYVNALKSINDHWKKMAQIAKINHEIHGVPYPELWPFIKNLFWLRSHTKRLKTLNKEDF